MISKTVSFLIFFGWLSSVHVIAQTLHFNAIGTTVSETELIASFTYKKRFSDYNSLQEEVLNLQQKFSQYGYIENQLIQLNNTSDSTYAATFHLGTLYSKARIYFSPDFNKKLIALVAPTFTNTYFEVNVSQLEASLDILNAKISHNGDPFSTLQLTDIKTVNGMIIANLITQEKQQRTIDSIIIKGYDKFPKSYLKHYLRLKTKQLFNLNSISQKTEALDYLQFANQIKPPDVLFTKDSTLLYIYVEKQKSNTFDGFIGFGTNTATSKIEFNGYLNLKLINTLNYGESVKVTYKSDESEQKSFDANANLPYLFGSPIGVALGLNIFKKDSSYITTSQTAKLDFRLNPKTTLGIGISSSISSNLLDVQPINISDLQNTFYNVSYHYEKHQRHDPLFPTNFIFQFTGGLGTRTLNNINETQSKFEVQTFKIFNLDHRNSLFANIEAAILNSKAYLENELFRFGGINSIRGFEENSITANVFGVLNTEYRYRVTNGLYINSIIDFAYYEHKNNATHSSLIGLGFGFGLLTNAGLFKLNYSNGSSTEQTMKLSDSKIHLSLTATF